MKKFRELSVGEYFKKFRIPRFQSTVSVVPVKETTSFSDKVRNRMTKTNPEVNVKLHQKSAKNACVKGNNDANMFTYRIGRWADDGVSNRVI